MENNKTNEPMSQKEFYRLVDLGLREAVHRAFERKPLLQKAARIRENFRVSFERLRAEGYM